MPSIGLQPALMAILLIAMFALVATTTSAETSPTVGRRLRQRRLEQSPASLTLLEAVAAAAGAAAWDMERPIGTPALRNATCRWAAFTPPGARANSSQPPPN